MNPGQPAAAARPRQDNLRESRVVQDVCDLLHDAGEKTREKVGRWIVHVLAEASRGRRWWFLARTARTRIQPGQDVIDLRGHVDRVDRLYAPRKLSPLPLARLLDVRMAAQAEGKPNAGAPSHYALEAGKRVHLWPAPAAALDFLVLYSRPMQLAILPDEWEGIVLNGVLGLFGRHFDRDALSQDPVEFERRFRSQMRAAAIESHDLLDFRTWDDLPDAPYTLDASSGLGAATEFLVPASLSGVGYVSVDTGDYPFAVG